ncbi:MAG: hypothetical protein QM774_01710 [Gordonia sp. (in: high G+C Gram-positive bacteria)]|uniref:hypothetical protein n=1 Tax=Gordonia sp. (in: high G+C Gram-positive bacteria) TaxID=84139 RepID=UPI0039E5D937
MTYPDPNRQNPATRAYSEQYPEYPQTQYTDQYGQTQYSQAQYGQPDYPPTQYGAAPAPAKPSRGPDVDPVMFTGGVLMTGVVTGLAAWLVAWIIRTVAQQINDSGKLGIWNPLGESEFWYAIVGFLAALFAGALWYVLQMITPTPNSFYRWVVGLLVAAAAIIPLVASLSSEVSQGIATAIIHLTIGLPVLALIPQMGAQSSKRRRQHH